MNTHDKSELPEPKYPAAKTDTDTPNAKPNLYTAGQVIAAIEADRKRRGEPVAWHTEDHLTDKSATTYDPVVAERWRAKGWPVSPLFQAPQPAEPVAYLDLGVGGYMDVGTALTDEQLAALPKGRHMLGIIGTYGVNGYREAAPQPAEPVAWLRSDQLRKLGRPYSDAPLNERADAMMLRAVGTPEAAEKYGHDVPVFAAPVAAHPQPVSGADELLGMLRDGPYLRSGNETILVMAQAADEIERLRSEKRIAAQPQPSGNAQEAEDDDPHKE